MPAAPAPAPRAGRGLELAEIVRTHGTAYRQTHPLARAQRRALHAIETCRTVALGGHRDTCDTCGAVQISYNSCRNRHCPKCQTLAKERWLAARRAELLPAEYFHVVFTLPHALNALAQGNPRVIYTLVFRGKYLQALHRAFTTGQLRFAGSLAALAEPETFATWLQDLRQHDWVVYAKRPLAGPTQVLEYLGRYTHRVAISNERLVSHTDDVVRFRWRDYADGDRVKIIGFLANRTRRAKLAR